MNEKIHWRWFSPNKGITLITGVLLFYGLYLTSLYRYVLFHSLAELITIVLAFAIFILAWNARRWVRNDYLLLVGMACLFSGILDMIHMLAYKGMNVFPVEWETTLASQLWIAARYLQSITLLTAPLFLKRTIKPRLTLAIYFGITGILLMSIFVWGIFPVTYVDGVGLTPFKIISEYIISLILIASSLLLYRQRNAFDTMVFCQLILFNLMLVGTELAFTSYMGFYDFANLLGHLFKIAAYYFIYIAIIITGLVRPFNLLFRDLAQQEQALQKEVAVRSAELSHSNELLKQELSERKRAEEMLESFNRDFEAFLNQTTDFIYFKDINSRFRFCSQALASITGHADWHELIGKHDCEVFPPNTARIYEEEEGPVFSEGRPILNKIDPFYNAAGRLGYVQTNKWPLFDSSGQVVGIFGISRDITEFKLAEDALRAKQELFQKTFSFSPLPSVLTRLPERTIVDVNPAFEQLFGFTRSEAIGRPVTKFDLWADPKERQRVAEILLKTGKVQNVEFIFKTKSGNLGPGIFYAEVIKQPEGKYVLAKVMDITERKRIEEDRIARLIAERANSAKSEFLSRMSHELRTPLNSILGFTQLLQMDELTPNQSSSLGQILKSGRHLLALINEVLDISRIEAGHMQLTPEPVQLEEALDSAVSLIRPLAEQRGISLEIKIPSSKDLFVSADAQRLKQVLINLLSNAVKYNREGGKISVTASLQMDGFLHLAVHDTGEGIPAEKMSRLFTAFDRLEFNPDQVEGTGLGLALSKGLVEAMGGRIGAASVVGEGSTFWLDLQLTTSQKEVIVMAEVDDYLKTNSEHRQGLILYVEDNLSNIQLIEKVLEWLPGVELLTAMQGSVGLKLAWLHKPDLILLDLHLPDMHGEEVLQ